MSGKIWCIIAMFLLGVVILLAGCSKTPPLPLLAPDAVILAFGDSLTAGTGAAGNESYPAVLSTVAGRKVINAGIAGEFSAAGLLRLPELLEREQPALLILCHGGNDLLGRASQQQLADNLRGMIRSARDRGIPVLLVAVPSPDFALKPPHLYEELAREFNLPVEMKILPHVLSKGALKSDYFHPNAAGYRMFAESLAGLLKKSGALPS